MRIARQVATALFIFAAIALSSSCAHEEINSRAKTSRAYTKTKSPPPAASEPACDSDEGDCDSVEENELKDLIMPFTFVN